MDAIARGLANQAIDSANMLQQVFGAHNPPSQRAAGRKMSAEATVSQVVTSLPGYADGYIRAVLKGLTMTNIVPNGNFANGTTGWASVAATLSASNGIMSITGNGSGNNVYLIKSPLFNPATAGKKYYFRARAKVTNNVAAQMIIYCSDNTTVMTAKQVLNPVQNSLYTLSGVITIADSLPTHFYVLTSYADAATASGKVTQVQDIVGVELTSLPAEIQSLSDAEITAWCDKQRYIDGTKLTQSQRIKAVGKNLFNVFGKHGKFNTIVESFLPNGVRIKGSAAYDRLQYNLRLEPNTLYTLKREISIVTAGTNTVNGLISLTNEATTVGYVSIARDAGPSVSFTSPSDGKMAMIIYANGTTAEATEFIFTNIQLEKGSATPYEPYIETVAHIPGPLRGLPNGVKDEINLQNCMFMKRISDVYALKATDITSLVTTGTYLDYVTVPVSAFTGHVAFTGLADGKSILFGYPETAMSDFDVATNVGKYAVDNTCLQIGLTKGTYASLAAAQAGLSGKQFIYQLETPVITQFKDLGQLDALPYGNIIIEPVQHGVKLPAFGTGKIPVTTADAPISSIESVYRIDTGADGQQVKVDVTSSFTVDADKTGITYAAADYTKPHEYVCLIDPACSTVPALTYSYPEADALALGIASKDYGAAAADWVLSSTEQQCGVLVCTNAGGAANIIAPDRKGSIYFVQNGSGQTLTVKKPGGIGATVATGKKSLFIHTGSDYVKFSEI